MLRGRVGPRSILKKSWSCETYDYFNDFSKDNVGLIDNMKTFLVQNPPD